MTKVSKNTKIIIGILILAGIIAPILLGSKNNYMMNLLISYCYFIILAASLNLLLGFTGQISLGHSAYFAIGAYTYAILNKTLGLNFLFAIIGSLIFTALVGLVIGISCTKLNAIFLAMATAGFAKAVTLFIINEAWLTGGANGFIGISKLKIFSHSFSNFELYYVALAITLMVLLTCYRLINSKTGRAFRAVRNSPIAAAAMGIDVNGYKLLANGISAALAALAGCIYVLNVNYLSADMFAKTSVKILTMCVAGGIGSLAGPVVGTIVITTLPELLRSFASHLDGIYGVLIILIMLFMPSGIYGGLQSLYAIIQKKAPFKKEKSMAK